MRHLASGGILVACSCSAHVTAEEFFETILRTLKRGGHRLHELERTSHPADHAASFPEAEYLKGIYLKCV
jgi:23S rRNA (cytosine1962-C5)-methyltransferase